MNPDTERSAYRVSDIAAISREYVDFLRNLAEVSTAHRQRVSDAGAPFGLNFCESAILNCLVLDGTVSTVRDIALYLHSAKSLISRGTEHLRQMGYISTFPSPDDRRVLCLQLTRKAEPVLQALKTCMETFVLEAADGIPPEELAAFKETSCKLLRNVRQAAQQQNSRNL